MEIRTDEISSIIRQQIESFDVDLHVDEVGTVARGRRRHRAHLRPPERDGRRDARVRERGRAASPSTSKRTRVGAVILGDYLDLQEGQTVKRTGRVLSVPVGEGLIGPRRRTRSASPSTARARSRASSSCRSRASAPAIADRQPVTRAAQTGIKAIDAMIPIGRGQRELIIGDRETGKTVDRHRRHHQPEGHRRHLRLRRHRPEGVDRGRRRRDPARARRHGLHDRRRRHGLRPGADAVHRSLRRLRHGRVLHVRAQPAHALHLRRPLEAGRRVPPAVAAAAPPAGPRGLPRRRVLPAQPAARARRQAPRPARRRLADRPADHRDAGRRRVGVHPDQRHLHHRRADLPRARPLLRRRAPRRERGHLGVPRGWQRPDQGA